MKKIISKYLADERVKYLATNGGTTFFGYLVTAVLTFAITYIVANYLDPHTTGVYRYVYSFYPVISAVALAGMNTALLKSIASHYDGTFAYAIRLKSYFSILGFVVTGCIAFYYFLNGNAELFWGFLALAISLPFFEISALVLPYLQGREKFWDMSLFSISSKIAVFFATVFAVFYFPNVFGIIISTVFLVSILQFYLAKHFYNKYKIEKSEVDPGFKKYSIHLSFMGIIYILGFQADKIIMFTMFGSVASAGYWIATIVPLEFQRMISSITSIYFAKLVRAEKENIKWNLMKILSISTFCMILVSFAYYFISPYIFEIFFPKYLEYLKMSQIAFWNICFVPFTFIWSYYSAKGNLKIMYFLHILDPVIQISLYFLLLPTFGAYGLLYGLLIKNFLFNTFAIIFFLKR